MLWSLRLQNSGVVSGYAPDPWGGRRLQYVCVVGICGLRCKGGLCREPGFREGLGEGVGNGR